MTLAAVAAGNPAQSVTPARVRLVWAALALNAVMAVVLGLGSAAYGGYFAIVGALPVGLLLLTRRPRAFRVTATVLAFLYLGAGLVLAIGGGLYFLLTGAVVLQSASPGRRSPRSA